MNNEPTQISFRDLHLTRSKSGDFNQPSNEIKIEIGKKQAQKKVKKLKKITIPKVFNEIEPW